MDLNDSPEPTAVTVGTFDGVHRGHRAVLRTLREEARRRGLSPRVITFSNHPLSVIAPGRAPLPLSAPAEKLAALTDEGVGVTILPFTRDMMGMTAREWMTHLRDDMNVRLIVVGYDNTFGSDGRSMSASDYMALGRELGIETVEAPVVEGCSSSAARRAVRDGDMPAAAHILGHPYSLTGTVEEGDRIGRTLGFPTANLRIPDADARLLPPHGVYQTVAVLPDGRRQPAVTNIGVRPTVTDKPELRIETHLLDFYEDLYGSTLTVEFLRRLRGERHFPSLEALKEAIAADKELARDLFNKTKS